MTYQDLQERLEANLKESAPIGAMQGVRLILLQRVIDNLKSGYYTGMDEYNRRLVLGSDLGRVGFPDLARELPL